MTLALSIVQSARERCLGTTENHRRRLQGDPYRAQQKGMCRLRSDCASAGLEQSNRARYHWFGLASPDPDVEIRESSTFVPESCNLRQGYRRTGLLDDSPLDLCLLLLDVPAGRSVATLRAVTWQSALG